MKVASPLGKSDPVYIGAPLSNRWMQIQPAFPRFSGGSRQALVKNQGLVLPSTHTTNPLQINDVDLVVIPAVSTSAACHW
jgi:hypothetical protein